MCCPQYAAPAGSLYDMMLNHLMVYFSGVLVCTDVMARGVDIPNVNFVLQFDPPSQAR